MVRGALGLILSLVCGVAHAANYSDIWWNPAESGWGITLADHETTLFGVWYTYRADGKPVWYTIPGGTFSSAAVTLVKPGILTNFSFSSGSSAGSTWLPRMYSTTS